MKILARYPVRFTIPLLLMFLCFMGSAAAYLLSNASGARLVENEAVQNIVNIIELTQSYLNDSLRRGDMEQLRKDIGRLTIIDGHRLTLVVNENQRIISASEPALEGAPVGMVAISGEAKERIADFFSAREGNIPPGGGGGAQP